ncbi:Rha family transcriptional regulator [Chromobacterium piscinae]|uniref:Rha family transcriptional regulator n=1 Tax=Chromobacterium piscinae TaxID=686831 RepID=UPI003F80C36C
MEVKISHFNDFVLLAGDGVVTDSRRVAKAFSKRHGDVLRAVDRLDCGEDFSQRNFASAEYLDEQGKCRREVRMTKGGFMFLVMGFTGACAGKIKVAFINPFNTMAEQIKRRDLTMWKQLHNWSMREANSKGRASFGSYLMLTRKREKPKLETE